MTDKTYTAYGLSNNAENVELHTATTPQEARDWVHGYIRSGDWGGYHGIAIADPSGEWITMHSAPEDDSEEEEAA